MTRNAESVAFDRHLVPESMIGPDAPGDEVIAWECRRCGEWVSEYRYDETKGPCRGWIK